MSTHIRKAAVLGGGVMGSGIAAHLANAGIPVLLLDIVPPKPGPDDDTSSPAFRNRFADSGKAGLFKQKPAPLFDKSRADLIETGNFDDHMHRLGEVDLVIEAVVENLKIKQSLFARVEDAVRDDCIVASNTSGLSITGMLEGRGDAFKKHFLVMHFFNPVRYMKLLELVAGPETLPEVVQTIHEFGEATLGKGIVYGKDTTNFIANRIGVYGMMKTMAEMKEFGLTVEEVDKIFGKAMGRPGSAVFRTGDLVGLDTLAHVAQNCFDTLTEDEERDVFRIPGFLEKMIEKGMIGAKAKKGFYLSTKGADGKRQILSLDLDTLEYTEQKQVRFDSLGAAKKVDDVRERVATVMKADDTAAKFAEKVTFATLAYTSRRIPEIADDIVNIDRGLRWGFGWDLGPFETWDAYGVADACARMKEMGLSYASWIDDMLAAGRSSFYAVEDGVDTYWDIQAGKACPVEQSDRIVKVAYLARGTNKVKENFGATLWDMGDGIALLEVHTKMNSIDDDVIKMMHDAVDIGERDFRGIVIGNDADNFSAGANIGAVLMAAVSGQFEALRDMISKFQQANQRMRYSSIPVIAAPGGLTLGGGAELAMGANAIQARSELYMGLVEVGVGLIPGGGGNLQLLRNLYGPYAADPGFDPFPFIKKAFFCIGMAEVATSAEEARGKGFLTPTDGVSLNADFALHDAKMRAIGMAEGGWRPPMQTKFLLPGPSGAATIDMQLWDMQQNGQISAHDRTIGSKLGSVLTGGNCSPTVPVTEDYLLEIEQEAFLSLCGEPLTHARLQAMLTTGKPLRN